MTRCSWNARAGVDDRAEVDADAAWAWRKEQIRHAAALEMNLREHADAQGPAHDARHRRQTTERGVAGELGAVRGIL
jgi:hypothetical protein